MSRPQNEGAQQNREWQKAGEPQISFFSFVEGADYPDDRAASRQFPKYVSRARRELANRPRYTFSGPPSAPYNKRPAHFTGDSSASLASHKSTTWDHGETTSGIGPHTFTLGGYAVRPPRSAGGDFSASSSYSQGQNMRRSGVASRKYPVQPAVRLVPENSKKMMTKTGLAPRAGYDHNLKYQQRGSHGRIMNNTARLVSFAHFLDTLLGF